MANKTREKDSTDSAPAKGRAEEDPHRDPAEDPADNPPLHKAEPAPDLEEPRGAANEPVNAPCPACGNQEQRYRIKSDPQQTRCRGCFQPV